MYLLNLYKHELIDSKRNFGLDLIRSMAILMVLLAHLGINESYTFGINLGSLGVEVFFVLSGFLIGQILIKTFSKNINLDSVLQFWIRRWFRTIPLYYLIVILKFCLVDHSLGYKILVYFFFLQNNFVGIDFMPVTWSLVIEEWFYLILPILLWIYYQRKAFSFNSLLIFIISFISFIIIARFVFVLITDRNFGAINGNFPFRLDSMMCGVLIAHLKLNQNNLYLNLTSFRFFITTLVIYICLLLIFGSINIEEGMVDTMLWTRTLWFFINSCALALTIPFIENLSMFKAKKSLIRFLITSISIFSYGAYLIHLEVYKYFLHSKVFSSGWLKESLLVVFLTFLISAVLYGFYEKPMTNLRDKVARKGNQAVYIK